MSEIIVGKDSVIVGKYCLKRSDHCRERLTGAIWPLSKKIVGNDCWKRFGHVRQRKISALFFWGNCLKRSTETGLPLSEAIVGNELVIVEKDLTIVGNDVRKRFCQGRKTIVGEALDIGGAIVEKCLVNV